MAGHQKPLSRGRPAGFTPPFPFPKLRQRGTGRAFYPAPRRTKRGAKMTLPDLLDITFQVTYVLEKLGIPYYIGGSVASSAFGMARATLDVDLVADIKSEHVSALEKALRDDFYIDNEMVLEAVRQRTCFNVIHMNTAFKVDVFIVKDRELSRIALRCIFWPNLAGHSGSNWPPILVESGHRFWFNLAAFSEKPESIKSEAALDNLTMIGHHDSSRNERRSRWHERGYPCVKLKKCCG